MKMKSQKSKIIKLGRNQIGQKLGINKTDGLKSKVG